MPVRLNPLDRGSAGVEPGVPEHQIGRIGILMLNGSRIPVSDSHVFDVGESAAFDEQILLDGPGSKHVAITHADERAVLQPMKGVTVQCSHHGSVCRPLETAPANASPANAEDVVVQRRGAESAGVEKRDETLFIGQTGDSPYIHRAFEGTCAKVDLKLA